MTTVTLISIAKKPNLDRSTLLVTMLTMQSNLIKAMLKTAYVPGTTVKTDSHSTHLRRSTLLERDTLRTRTIDEHDLNP